MTDPATAPGAITRCLAAWREGLEGAGDRLVEAAYPEFRKIAARFLANERSSHTLDPNALVHELWLRMTSGEAATFADRSHFYALAARMMRNILIDHARARAAGKRGGDQRRVSLSAVDGWRPVTHDEELLSLNAALSALEQADPRVRGFLPDYRDVARLRRRDVSAAATSAQGAPRGIERGMTPII